MADQERLRRPGGRQHPKEYTWKQASLITSYRRMGRSIAQELAGLPKLAADLSRDLHSVTQELSPGSIYTEMLRKYFLGLEQNGNLEPLVDNPFVRAFEQTPQCSDEESSFLDQFRAGLGRSPTDFREWLETRLIFMARGLQSAILDHKIIEPLSSEELSKLRSVRLHERWETDLEWAARFQQQGTEAAAANVEPSTFTPSVRKKIQRWFDRGLDYDTVVELLRGIGVNTSKGSLATSVVCYEDLHYTLEDMRAAKRLRLREAAEEIFRLSQESSHPGRSPRKTTMDILGKLGYSPANINDVLHKLGLRDRIDWTTRVEVKDQNRSLREIAAGFIQGNYPNTVAEHSAFLVYLQEHGINMDISLPAYKGIRRSIIRRG